MIWRRAGAMARWTPDEMDTSNSAKRSAAKVSGTLELLEPCHEFCDTITGLFRKVGVLGLWSLWWRLRPVNCDA